MDIETITANLRTIRAEASAQAISEGTEWYPSVEVMCAQWAEEFDHDIETVAGVIASYSQNATWKANLTMARNYFTSHDEPRGLKSVVAECERIVFDGDDPAEAIGALKRPDFYRNIIGQHEYVTCDRWHLRAAYGDAGSKIKLTDDVRAMVTEATTIVAREHGETPATCQAIIWCAVRGTGA